MFPEAFIKRIEDQKMIDSGALLNALEESSPVSIRINRSKWRKAPQGGELIPWCDTGFYLKNRPSFTLDPLFHAGCYYPQEASSMFIEQALKQIAGTRENMRVLDLCGAPGGKTTHLAALLARGSLLVANDTIRPRASILAETVTKWGYENTMVTQNDPKVFGRLPGFFDVILVDAPCSGEGMFRNKIAVSEWSVDNTLHCSERQKRILTDIWPALKENGILVYSTCTFNPGENEDNIKWLLGKHEAKCERINLSDFEGIKEIDYDGIFGYGFYPGEVRGEGFFISVIRKTGKQLPDNFRNQKKHNLMPGRNDIKISEEWTKFPGDRLLKWDDEIFAVPCGMDEFLNLFHNLNVIKSGTRIFAIKKDRFLPSHELALSTQIRKDAFPQVKCDLNMAVSYLRRDNIFSHDVIKGWNIVSYCGINLGFVKNLGNRINNYFPVEWRIRMDKPESIREDIIRWD